MRWKDERRSDNVEDRRGMSGSKVALGGGGGIIVIAIIVWLLGGNPMDVLKQAGNSQQQQNVPNSTSAPPALSEQDKELGDFVSAVLADTEDVWHEQFSQKGRTYQDPKLVLFTDSVQSACGVAGSQMGPFYCPGDEKVYIDLSFYQDLKNLHNAPGDFAQAYVIAHEIGHHVQNLLGISQKVHDAMQRSDKQEANELSVLLELQADCLAGVWAFHAQKERQILEPGDIEEALGAASAIGDDRLQKEAQGYVVPESFTHGTSEQRVRWFSTGFKTGDINQCDTFK
jgi:uncharacterized protein